MKEAKKISVTLPGVQVARLKKIGRDEQCGLGIVVRCLLDRSVRSYERDPQRAERIAAKRRQLERKK